MFKKQWYVLNIYWIKILEKKYEKRYNSIFTFIFTKMELPTWSFFILQSDNRGI